jgi:hypothetical protein
MSCPACRLDNPMEFSAEMIVHLGGLKNLEKSGVLLFPKLLVCVSCGFSQFTSCPALRFLRAGNEYTLCNKIKQPEFEDEARKRIRNSNAQRKNN